MVRESPVSDRALNGSALGDRYGSDSSEETLYDHEALEDAPSDLEGQSIQDFRREQPSQEGQPYSSSQSSEEQRRSDIDYHDPSASMETYLNDSDLRVRFRLGGQVLLNVEQEQSITLPKKRHDGGDETGRSSSAKKSKRRKTKKSSNAGKKEGEMVERVKGPSHKKRSKRDRDGTG